MIKSVFFLGVTLIVTATGVEDKDMCQYIHDTRTYFCRNIQGVFPNIFYGNYHLRCIDCNLGIFTNSTFPFTNNLVSFNASNSAIQVITQHAFSSLSNVQYIYLQDNEIEDIAPDAFWGLRQVYELHLENNDLTGLVPGFVNDLEANTVILSNNRIKSLKESVFGGSLGFLILDLSKNLIKSLDLDAFVSLDVLEILNLQHNQICYFPLGVFRHLTSLRQLNVADNKLTKFTLGTFSALSHLNVLNLANNSLGNFDSNILIPFIQLTKLDLSGNGIYYLDANSLYVNVPTLRTLRIDDNLLSCGDLITVIQYLKKNHVQVVSSVGRYKLQNVNGIACIQMILEQTVEFRQFLKVAEDDTKKSVQYC